MQQNNFGSTNRYGSGAQQQQQGGGNFHSYRGMNQEAPSQGGQFNVGQQGPPQGIVWTPPSPQEKHYYDMLFQIADDERTGAIGGRSAVMFFTKSGLDKSILREVWTIADSRQTSFLLLKDFYVAMRLIALAQQGHPVNLPHFYELASSPFALARLEGVPPPQQQQQQPPASTYAITSDEKTKYQGIFAQYDTDHDGFLLGQDAAALFQMSGMDRNDLRTVWTLADRSSDGRLDLTEFYIAMHLIVCVTKRGLPLPQTLPLELEQSLRSTGSFSQPASGHLQPTQPPQPPAPVQGMSAFDDLDGGSPAAAESSSIGFGNSPDISGGNFPSGSRTSSAAGLGTNAAGFGNSPNAGFGQFGSPSAAPPDLGQQRQASFAAQPPLGASSGTTGPTSGFCNSQTSFGSPAQPPMDGFGNQAPNSFAGPPTSGFGSSQRQGSVGPQAPSSFGGFGASSPAQDLNAPFATPAASDFGSRSRQASFGAQPSVSASSAVDGFGKHEATRTNSFGLPTTPQSAPSLLTSGFGSQSGLNAFGSPISAPPATVPSPATSGFGNTPSSPGNFGDFGLSAPVAPEASGLGSNPSQPSGGFGGFDSPVRAPLSTSDPVTSGFGSNKQVQSSGFGEFGLSPSTPAVKAPSPSALNTLPTSNADLASPAQFGSNKAASSTLPPSGFGSFPEPPSSVSSGFGDFPSPTNTSAFGDFCGATSSAPEGFGSPNPPATTDFGDFGASATGLSTSGFGSNKSPPSDFGVFSLPPPPSASTIPTSTTFGSSKSNPIVVEAPSGFGSNKSTGFGEFDVAPVVVASQPSSGFGNNSVSSGFADFPSPTNSSGFGDFSSSSAPPAPSLDVGSKQPSTFGSTKPAEFTDFTVASSATTPTTTTPVDSSQPPPQSSSFGTLGRRDSGAIPLTLGTSAYAPASTSGFDGFPSPISTTTFEGFGLTPSTSVGDPPSALSAGFEAFSSSGPVSSLEGGASDNHGEATARDLDAANASLLRSLTELAVSQKHVVQVTHIQHLATNLLRLTAQRDQHRAAQSTDPTVSLAIQRLIDDERAFISTTSAVLQELEQKKPPSSSLSRQPSASSATTSAFDAFEF
ncbi:hypothetical protein H257_01826 [Aphanomyces astaci]|uniref:Uncharacterized protein n=1 Tax=Aphanomyces astaci TaxID=112090 RepID=W4H625_APHAT|nr:hypothetical protein H257_01826 [Aphanomyces astaci]ETV86729.1 hypothetical protein H257_01826 [Aphanomyces astaci]|eukprot:XP_009823528.1 hypothetical protein H257_01826 [Aphanomyces astaci]